MSSGLLILSTYVPSMPPLLTLPLFMVCNDSSVCVAMVIGSQPWYSLISLSEPGDDEYECFRHFSKLIDHSKLTNVGTCIGEATPSYACSNCRILAGQRDNAFAAMAGVAFDIAVVTA
ncbi:hypothetical protein Tco_0878615 [Tanacetum coccineum]|uniref:Uncharacterized protein n=1 Tax=Tanacetum coccineum TaxID=301880 RepID=A0ABQ5C094_9ASTR